MSGSSARRGASPTSLGAGSAVGDGVGGRSLPGSAQGTPVHVPMPPSTDGTPSTAYLERARDFAERMQASMASAVKEDQLYNTLAASPATESFASARAKELMEELIEAERRRDDGALRFEENPNDLADRIARLANEPPRTGREEDAEGGANDARGSYDERFDERFGDALDTAAPSVSFAARVERIPPPTVDRRGGDARARVDGRDDTAGEAGATGEAGPSGLSGLARPLRSFTYGDGDATDVSLSFDREVSGEASRLEEPRGAPSPGGAEPGSPNGAPVASTTGRALAADLGAADPGTADPNSAEPTAFGRDVRSSDRFALFAKYLPEDDASGAAARRRVGARGAASGRERELERVRAENASLAKKVARLEKRRAEVSEKLFVSERERKSLRSRYVAAGEKLEAVSRESAAVADAERDAATRLAVLESRRVEAKRRIKSLEKALERATRERETAEALRARAEEAAAAAAARRDAEGEERTAVARLAASAPALDVESARKESASLRDALDLERRERGAAERALTECEAKLARAIADANGAEESARRAATRADVAAIESDAAVRRKVALEEQRLSVETERRAFEMETAFARRERARDRELDELKLELERVTMEANEAKKSRAAASSSSSAAAAAREQTLALPAPRTRSVKTRDVPSRRAAKSSSDSDRSGSDASPDASRSERDAPDDVHIVAARLAKAVLRALDERAGGHARADVTGHSSLVAAGAASELAETRRVAEEARAAAAAALKASEDETRRRETEALIEARLFSARLVDRNSQLLSSREGEAGDRADGVFFGRRKARAERESWRRR